MIDLTLSEMARDFIAVHLKWRDGKVLNALRHCVRF